MKPALFFILYIIIPNPVESQEANDAKALRVQIFETDAYDKKIRPATNQSDSTEVYVSFYLLSINELDEVAETLKTTGYLVVEWNDDFLSWDPSDYGGLYYYLFPQDDVWKPDVALKNSVEKYKPLGVSTLNVWVGSDGNVVWYPFEVFQSTCSIDITYFPFDVQTCKLEFVAWSYSKIEVFMMGGSRGIDLEQYSANSEWDLIDSVATVEDESLESSVIYTLKIRRKPRYMVLSVILPIVMLSVLNMFVFVLPCDSGEKASYAVTVFLAFAVFLTIISSALPRNSESLSIFSVYIIILTVQSTLITITALIILRIRQLETAVPTTVHRLVKLIYCRCCKRRSCSVTPQESFAQSSMQTLSTENGFSAKQVTSEKLENLESSIREKSSQETCDWKAVANTLDIFFFCLFAIVTCASSSICLIYASSAT